MASASIRPVLLIADAQGNIYDNPDFLMLCRRGDELALPGPDELMPLPEESELFMLPGRRAVGFNSESGLPELQADLAVAAFVAPAHTLTAHPAYRSEPDAPVLPLFAYGAVGYANGRMYVCARKVDEDPRQVFSAIAAKKLRRSALEFAGKFAGNRLVQHLVHKCALTYNCPAARNLCLGRYEAPLPVARACNARCVGCISRQENGSKICTTPQNRMDFTPTAEELVEVMLHHGSRAENPIYSFGQGCEGEPLTESGLISEAVSAFRSKGGKGTVNLNSNASRPDAVADIAEAGLSSMRVSLNSVREESYMQYYRPLDYAFEQVRRSISAAKERGVFVSLNLLYFPGFTDTEKETAALSEFVRAERVDCIQLRNLNIDPEFYLELIKDIDTGPVLGLKNFRKRLAKECQGIRIGYFNPPLPG